MDTRVMILMNASITMAIVTTFVSIHMEITIARADLDMTLMEWEPAMTLMSVRLAKPTVNKSVRTRTEVTGANVCQASSLTRMDTRVMILMNASITMAIVTTFVTIHVELTIARADLDMTLMEIYSPAMTLMSV
jgi:hypothetical protein